MGFRRWLANLIDPRPEVKPGPVFVRSGKCPVCGEPSGVYFTKRKGRPYEACDKHRIGALLIKCHNEGARVIRVG